MCKHVSMYLCVKDPTTFLATCATLAVTMLIAWGIIVTLLPRNVGNPNKRIIFGLVSVRSFLLAFLILMPIISVGVLFFTLMPLAGAAPAPPLDLVAGFIVAQGFYYAIFLVAKGWQVVKPQPSVAQASKKPKFRVRTAKKRPGSKEPFRGVSSSTF